MDARQRILSALTDDDATLRKAGLEVIVDHLLAQRVDSLVDVALVTDILTTALTSQAGERTVERHIIPAIARVREALQSHGERVGDAVPTSALADLDALVTHPRGPRFAWMRGALDRDTLRTLIAPALQEMFVRFAQRLPLGTRDAEAPKAVTAAASFAKRLGRGTGERLKHLGKSVADNLGLDLEGRLGEIAREYSHGAVAGLERALLARLATPEGKQLVEGLARSVLEHVLRTPMAVILADLDRLPLADAFRLAPPILQHNLAREVWRGIVEREVRIVLAIEADRSLGDLLDDAGLRTTVRDAVVERGEPVMRSLAASPAFSAWLGRILGEPE